METENIKEPRVAERVRREQFARSSAAIRYAAVVVFLVSALGMAVYASDLAALITQHSEYYYKEYLAENVAIIRLVAAMIFTVALGFITYLYASGSLTLSRSVRDTDAADLRSLALIADSIRDSADAIAKNRVLSAEEQGEIVGALENAIRQGLSTDFLKRLDEKYGESIKDDKTAELINVRWKDTERRLANFQRDVSRKANAALAWGVGTGFGGLVCLLYFILFGVHPSDSGAMGGAFHYVARLSLVAIVETVAFFFLRLYRETLQDEKYVNNELTNTEFRLLALTVSITSNDKKSLQTVLADLSRTERNFALKKGEVPVFQGGQSVMLPSSVIADLVSKLMPIFKPQATHVEEA